MHPRTRTGISPLPCRLTIELMRLAPSTGEGCSGSLTADHELRHVRGSCNEFLRPFTQFPAVLHLADIPFHVLRAPAPRMRDERKLRELAADFGEKAHDLPGHAWTLSCPPMMINAATLFLSKCLFAMVT